MKNFKTVVSIVFFLLLFTVSCQRMESSKSNGDYYAGSSAGELLAKEDALNYRCIDYQTQLSHMIRSNINKHLKGDKNIYSDTYIKGFKWGYEVAFRDLTNAYCGGDPPSELLKN